MVVAEKCMRPSCFRCPILVSYPIARGIINGNFYIVIMTGSLNLRSELVLLAQMSTIPLVRKGPRGSEAVSMYVPLFGEVECEN